MIMIIKGIVHLYWKVRWSYEKNFKLEYPKGIAYSCFILIFIFILIDLISFFSNDHNFIACIITSLFLIFQFLLGAIFILRKKIYVSDDIIYVSKFLGSKFSVDVKNIDKITWRYNVSKGGTMPVLEKIDIKVKSKKFYIETMFSNYDKMAKYLLENVDNSKIEVLGSNIDELRKEYL